MTKEDYTVVLDYLDRLRIELNLKNVEPAVIPPSNSVAPSTNSCEDIIVITAKKINNRELRLFTAADVDWGVVTLFDMDNIKRLLSLVDVQWLEDSVEAIIHALKVIYAASNGCSIIVSSEYYPVCRSLPNDWDWDYEKLLNNLLSLEKISREKAEAFRAKVEADSNGANKIDERNIKLIENLRAEIARRDAVIKELQESSVSTPKTNAEEFIDDSKVDAPTKVKFQLILNILKKLGVNELKYKKKDIAALCSYLIGSTPQRLASLMSQGLSVPAAHKDLVTEINALLEEMNLPIEKIDTN